MMKRGVITSPAAFTLLPNGRFSIRPALTSELMKYYLIYWDEILIPRNNIIGTSNSVIDEALTLGNVYSPCKQFRGQYGGHEIVKAILGEQVELAALFKKHPDIDWVLHQHSAENILFPENHTTTLDIVRFQLNNILPVPTVDTSFHDILEFKRLRSDELARLHSVIDELYLSILSSPDQDLSSKKSFQELQDSINNLDVVVSERYGLFKKLSCETSFSIKGDKLIGYPLFADAMTAIAEHSIQLPSELSIPIITTAAVSGIASGLNCKIQRKKIPTDINDKLHLSYLVNARNEKIISL